MKLNHLGKLPREENSRRKQLSEDFENSVTLYAFQEMRSLASKSRGKEADRKDGKKDHDSRSAPEPKKAEENPASVSVKEFLSFLWPTFTTEILYMLQTEWLKVGIAACLK